MHVIIPTHRRVWAQNTYMSLPEEWRARTTFYVDRHDHPTMATSTRYRAAEFVVVPEHVKTIAQKRAFILQSTPHEHIVMFDDDLRFANRIPEADAIAQGIPRTRLVQSTPDTVGSYLLELERKLRYYAHAGFGPRQGNNRQAGGWGENGRMMYVLGYHVPTVLRHCEIGRIEHREDMDYCLQLLRAGHENRVCTDICVDQKYNAPGGASKERTMEASNADAHKLAELHPGLVKVTTKEYKTSLPRNEVMCYWKKAYALSRT